MREQEALGDRLRRLREAAGLSQEQLAHTTYREGKGLTSSAVAQFERGVSNPSPKTLLLLVEGLGVPPEEFPEYRLWMARRLFDERAIGLDVAATNLAALEGGEPLLDRVDWEVARQAKAARPNGRAVRRSSSPPAKKRRKSA